MTKKGILSRDVEEGVCDEERCTSDGRAFLSGERGEMRGESEIFCENRRGSEEFLLGVFLRVVNCWRRRESVTLGSSEKEFQKIKS